MTISDINQEIRDLCDADATSLTNATLLRRVNTAYESIVGRIIMVDGTFQFDDDNFTTSPRGVATLVSGQNSYAFSDKFLQIEEVDILDLNGRYRKIEAFDPSSTPYSFEEYFNISYAPSTYTAPSGMPRYYDKQGNLIRFDRAPTAATVTLTSGLRVTFKRTASLYTSAEVTTGTKVPGFDSQFHILICYMAAIPFCQSYKKDRIALYEKKVMDLERDLLEHYGYRQKDKRDSLVVSPISYR